MNNLKRVLSLGLSGVMLAGLLSVGASAADFTDAADIEHSNAVNTLVALKVIDGKPDGSFAPEETVTRSQMAKMIAKAMNGGSETTTGTKTNPSFTDIKGHWAESYIEYCYDLGIISGRGDGTFDPDATVTGLEATKMVLTALGYDSEAYQLIGAKWASRTDELAKSADPALYEELVGTSMNANATRDVAAQLIWNGLQNTTKRVRPTTGLNTGSIEWTYEDGDMMLYERYGGLIWTGTFTGNGDTGDTSENAKALEDGQIAVYGRIDGAPTLDSDGKPIAAKTAAFPSDFDIANIGEEVKVIFKDGASGIKNQPDKKDTIYGVFNTGTTEVINAVMDDIDDLGGEAKLKIDGSKYNLADDVTVTTDYDSSTTVKYGKDKTSSTSGYAGGTNNDDADDDKNSDLTVALQGANSNAIKFVCDTDGKINAAYVTTYNVGRVTSVTSTKITVNGLGSLTIADHDVEEGLKVDDIVSYTKFYNSDNDKAFITIAKAETVEGDITGFDGTTKVSVDGTSYKIVDKKLPGSLTSDSMTSFDGEIDTTVKAYLVNGWVAGVDKVESGATSWALVVGATKSGTSDKDFTEGKVRLLMADGTKTTYVVDEDSDIQPSDTDADGKAIVGDLVKYSVKSDGSVDIKAVAEDKKNTANVWNEDNKQVAETAVAETGAVLYTSTSASGDYKVYDIRTLKTITAKGALNVFYVKNSAGRITVAFADLKAEPAGATSDRIYGMVTGSNGTVKVGDDECKQYKVWTADGEMLVNLKDGSLTKGDYVTFEETNDGVYKSANFTAISGSSVTIGSKSYPVESVYAKEYSTKDQILSYYEKTLLSVDGKTYSGDESTLKSKAIDKDAVIVYVDKNDNAKGDDIGISSFNTGTGFANVKYVANDEGVIVAIFVETSDKKDIDGNAKATTQQLYAVSVDTDKSTAKYTYTLSATEGKDKDVITLTIKGDAALTASNTVAVAGDGITAINTKNLTADQIQKDGSAKVDVTLTSPADAVVLTVTIGS